MPAFGDESGNISNLLEGNCPCFCIGVIAGHPHQCRGPVNRALERVDNTDELKWRDLTDVERRRFCESLADRSDSLTIAYATLLESDIQQLENAYVLYQDRFPDRRDLSVMSIYYSAIMNEIFESLDRPSLTFERYYAESQSDTLKELIASKCVIPEISYNVSTNHRCLQAADAVAGAGRATEMGRCDWFGEYNVPAHDVSYYAQAELELALNELAAP